MDKKDAREIYEFGPFRVDSEKQVLLREDQPVPLAPKTFETLLVLIRHNREVVTKDDLMKAVWPDTFVEETNLSRNIFLLRRALGEDGRYIVTLPGRGYRFAEQVRLVPRMGTPGVVIESHSRSEVVIEHGKANHWPWLAGSLLLLAITAGIAGYFFHHRKPRLTERDTVVLIDFANSTADPVFDETLKTALEVSLRQSPFLNTLSQSKMAKTLQLMTLPRDTKVTPEVGRELCQRAGSKAFVAGSIGNLGREYVLELKAVSCQTGDTLAEEIATADSKEKVLSALGEAVSKLRRELGESLATVRRFDVPVEEATTPSLEALKAYSLGRRVFWEKGPTAALPYSRQAIDLDSNFAMAYRAVGIEYRALGEVERAREYVARSFQLREHASEREKLEITAAYYATVTGEGSKAIQAYQQLIGSYPRDGVSYLNLGVEYGAQGQYEKAADVTRQGMRLAPDQSRYHFALSTFCLALGRFEEARQVLREAQELKLDELDVHTNLYGLDFLGDDSAGMAEELEWFAGDQAYQDYGAALASDTAAYWGHVTKARELIRSAVDSARRADNKETAALWEANAALRATAYGSAAEARQSAAAALKLAPASAGADTEAALAYAMANDPVRAESLTKDLRKRFPLDTQLQTLWLPAVQTQLALDRGSPAVALTLLQPESPVEFGNIPFGSNISCLCPTYVRGQAYLAAGRGDAAAREFQKFLDHRSIVWNCWTGALARLGLARANALESRSSKGIDAEAARTRALAAYQDFLTLWKDADPAIPILKQAREEYARLQ